MSISKDENSKRHEMFDAIYHGDYIHVKDMLSQGVSANTSKGSETAFIYAASHGQDECVEALLEYGATYEALPIIDAAEPRNPTVLRRFLQMGGDPGVAVLQDALMRAAFYGNADTVRLLLAHGADPTKKGSGGYSVLDTPQEWGTWDCTPEERDEVLALLREASEQKAA